MTATDRKVFESAKKTVDSDSKATGPITKELRDALDRMWPNPELLEIADRIDAEHERRMGGAVPVVRCKECTWFRNVDGLRLCVRNRNVTCLVDWDDYCSEGVRYVEELSSYGGVPPMGKVSE